MPDIIYLLTQLGLSPATAAKLAGYWLTALFLARLLRPLLTRAVTWFVDRFDDISSKGRSDGAALLIIVDSGIYRLLFVLVDFFLRVHLPTRETLEERWRKLDNAQFLKEVRDGAVPDAGSRMPDAGAVDGRKLTGVLVLALLLGLGAFGCAGPRALDPQGVYQGDKILFTADETIVGAYGLLHAFVRWEYEHRASLAQWPEIRKAADAVRLKGEGWIDSANALRDAYKASPTEETRTALASSLTVLRTALAQASKQMTTHAR